MKKIKILLLIIFLATIAFAQEPSEIFSSSSLVTEIEIGSTIDFRALKSGAKISSFQTDVLFFPKEDKNLKLFDFSTEPASNILGDKLRFAWNNPPITQLEYSYKTKVETKPQMPKIYSRIAYPINIPSNVADYTKPTNIIDSQSPAIKNKAEELAKGKDDLYEVVATIGIWVKDNIKYDLSTLTSQATQKAGPVWLSSLLHGQAAHSICR